MLSILLLKKVKETVTECLTFWFREQLRRWFGVHKVPDGGPPATHVLTGIIYFTGEVVLGWFRNYSVRLTTSSPVGYTLGLTFSVLPLPAPLQLPFSSLSCHKIRRKMSVDGFPGILVRVLTGAWTSKIDRTTPSSFFGFRTVLKYIICYCLTNITTIKDRFKFKDYFYMPCVTAGRLRKVSDSPKTGERWRDGAGLQRRRRTTFRQRWMRRLHTASSKWRVFLPGP